MCTFTKDELKTLVLETAKYLCTINGSTTTLDVKNQIHLAKPGCGLKQVEVSAAMKDLFDEGTNFERENQSTNGDYFIYSLKVPVTNDASATTAAPAASSSAASIAYPAAMAAIAGTGIKAAVLGDLGQHPVDFLKKLDGGVRVAFNAGKSDYVLTNTTDRFEARNLFKVATGAKHNDVRTITIKTYLNRLAK